MASDTHKHPVMGSNFRLEESSSFCCVSLSLAMTLVAEEVLKSKLWSEVSSWFNEVQYRWLVTHKKKNIVGCYYNPQKN